MAEKTIAAKEPRGNGKIYVGAYVSVETHKKIVELGKPRELSISDIVREAVREYIAKQEALKAEV